MAQVAAVKCSHVMVQLNLGYYDHDGNLIGEETYPQVEGNVIVAKIFHPHGEQLDSLIKSCIDQAWQTLKAREQSQLLDQGPGSAAAEA